MKKKQDIRKKLNLNYLNLTNKTYSSGEDDLPALYCNTTAYPDFLALSGQPGLYWKTKNTGICFYEYDDEMDGIHGLYEAIYHNDRKLLADFKKRFQEVRFFITPDYSECGDIHAIENKYRLFKSRIVGLWLMHELDAVVIPHVTYPLIKDIGYALTGLEGCSVVAFSTKGYATDSLELNNLIEAVKYTTDKLSLHAIVVYDACGDDSIVNQVFEYPRKKGIQIVVPGNTLKERNALKKGGNDNEKL